jgi:mono/diheme cytochrome c family protein
MAWLGAPVASADQPARVEFAGHVQPIFVEHCYQCHGPDKQESNLRLDVREAALKGGDAGAWFVAGNSRQSEMVRRISSADPDERMPPVSPRTKALSSSQIATIANWIDQGAVWPETKAAGSNHWAYQPIERPAPPAVKNGAWVRGAIDRFVLARLEARGFAPTSEADRYTLIKRLSYDLLGLPPEVEEVDAFVRDPAPDAYESLVNRLLDSPRFGERWGRRWLDMARYADSDGYEKDNPRLDAWRYRDWTIDAVNADMPLDRFTIEQLAGDLLPGATPEARLATAFHRQTLTNTEGGADQEQFRVEAIFDRVATTGSVWLGLTIGCAQCHSHKYDAITHAEFYQLFAFFNNGDETEIDMPLSGESLDKWTRERDSAQQKLEKLEPQLEKARAEFAAKLPAWEAELKGASIIPLEFHPVELVSAVSSAGADLKLLSDGSYLVAGKSPDVDKVSITAKTDLAQISGFRVETLAHDSFSNRGPGRSDEGNFVLSEFRAFAAPTSEIKSEHRVAIAQAQADFAQDGFPAAGALDGKEPTGWGIAPQVGRDHQIVFVAKQLIPTQSTPWLKLVLSQNQGARHTIGRFRVMAVTGNDPRFGLPKEVVEILAVPAEKRTSEQARALVDYYYTSQDAKAKELVDEVKKLRQRVAAKPIMKVRVLAERADKRRASHVLHRGNFLQPTTEVQPGTLAVLPHLKPRVPGKADRLDLARWLVDPANPLTRRVMVNQLWSSLFGRGIVRTPNDFGVRGQGPTHPELLDWLAAELVERRWSRKEMIRLIVASAAYRQASHNRAELAEADPLNELLHRQNRFRVEAEIVRDLALAAGGILSEKIGGPSVYPPLPPDIAELSYANNFKWTASTGDDRYRRGMYTFFKRTAPHPNLSTFDCPDSNTTCIERRTSNTPLQALTTLNNEVFAEAAQAMAGRVLAAAADDTARLTLALRWCIARPPSADELSAFGELLTASRQWYTSHATEAQAAVGSFKPEGANAEEAAAWVATVRIMINLDEFLTRE